MKHLPIAPPLCGDVQPDSWAGTGGALAVQISNTKHHKDTGYKCTFADLGQETQILDL